MRTSSTTTEIAGALVKLQTMIENPIKSQRVNAGAKKYAFAPLPEILDTVRPLLALHGLALVQEATTPSAGTVGVTTRIFHSSGEWIEYEPLSLPAGNDAQAAGSAITYARRYSLTAALGIAADEDDDGAGTTARRPEPTKAPPTKTASSAGGAETPPTEAPVRISGGTPAPERTGGGGQSVMMGEGTDRSTTSGSSLHSHEYAPSVDHPGDEECVICGRRRKMKPVVST